MNVQGHIVPVYGTPNGSAGSVGASSPYQGAANPVYASPVSPVKSPGSDGQVDPFASLAQADLFGIPVVIVVVLGLVIVLAIAMG